MKKQTCVHSFASILSCLNGGHIAAVSKKDRDNTINVRVSLGQSTPKDCGESMRQGCKTSPSFIEQLRSLCHWNISVEAGHSSGQDFGSPKFLEVLTMPKVLTSSFSLDTCFHQPSNTIAISHQLTSRLGIVNILYFILYHYYLFHTAKSSTVLPQASK